MSSEPTRAERIFSPRTIFTIFAGAGVLHLAKPEPWEAMVPPQLPAKRALVYASGVAEIVGGAGYLYKPTRTLASKYLVLLLIAVFPSNIHMALEPKFFKLVPGGQKALLARLPIQFVGMWWVRRLAKRTAATAARAA
ncbi:MAG: hypothetical protein Q7T55_16630 [Solirubrobacteraceae bacterium]|nr:hypothetical protein [Solirubrobacteraceae bacterium]